MRARLPTAARISSTSSTNVGRSGPTASMMRSLDSAAHVDAQAGEVVDVDGTDAVVAAPADAEHREVPQQPRDVVDEHTVFTEEDRRAEDRVGDAGLGERALDEGLAAEVRIRRLDRRVGDAHVHDALHAGPARRVEQRPRVLDGLLVARRAVREPHPVGVVQRRDAFEVAHQRRQVREVEGPHLDGRRRVGVLRMARERADRATVVEQAPRDGAAAVAERAGHGVESGVGARSVESRLVRSWS